MDQLFEIIKMLASLKDNPLALVCILAFAALGVAASAIYAVILIVKKQHGEKL